MIKLPDGMQIDMRWKTVSFTKGNNKLVLDIEPMMNCEDIVYFPSENEWRKIKCIFSNEERLEIIFLLERINWKRNIKIFISEISPRLLSKDDLIITEGTLESTIGGREIEEKQLFDPDSPLNSEQVHELYCKLEKKFANQVNGEVIISRNKVIPGSVFEEVSMKTLMSSSKVEVKLMDY
ncbi:hypothetical protein EJP82_27805 [Paenibacillus anaericanus]|uniref:Uncharacterized protein n=1 Tax=Paenibacillus anaericanus TaxID=170367 RepID=A0A433XU07_9BACL|nr:hypothetical protein [Paenibacillus anaericanus]RUT37714.1 hypothetical protein EJP82_27805 [Paenibacillus anaericanus]